MAYQALRDDPRDFYLHTYRDGDHERRCFIGKCCYMRRCQAGCPAFAPSADDDITCRACHHFRNFHEHYDIGPWLVLVALSANIAS